MNACSDERGTSGTSRCSSNASPATVSYQLVRTLLRATDPHIIVHPESTRAYEVTSSGHYCPLLECPFLHDRVREYFMHGRCALRGRGASTHSLWPRRLASLTLGERKSPSSVIRGRRVSAKRVQDWPLGLGVRRSPWLCAANSFLHLSS